MQNDEQRRRDHAHLMEAQKSVRKSDGGNRRPAHYNTLSTIVRNLRKRIRCPAGKTHQYYPIIAIEDYRKGFMNTAIDNYFNSSYGFVFCQRENISQSFMKFWP
jgi:hypothetical protein